MFNNQNLPNDLVNSDIPALMEKLEGIYRANPKYHRVINIELESICKKYKLIKGNMPSLIEVNEDDVRETEEKIKKKLNRDFKVPDLRNKATELAQKYKIPFPSATRKNRTYLMLWFRDNWEELESLEGENFLSNI